ncbi:MSF1-domain-containing protein, partial [Tilletiopsis washingtonensis]
MPQTYLGGYTLAYAWPQAAFGVLHKYPNAQTTHVTSVDVIEQRFDAASGLLRLERILGVVQGAPGWVTRLLGGPDETFVREVVMIDPASSLLEMTSTNLTLSQFLLVKEYITYTPTAGGGVAQPCGTQFSQRALIQAGNLGLAAVARKVEGWSVSRFGSNAAKGKLGIEEVLRNMWSNAS